MTRFWSPVVHGLSPYVPGEQPKRDGLIKLNTNENPYAPSPRVLEAIAAATDRLRLYPDPSAAPYARRSRLAIRSRPNKSSSATAPMRCSPTHSSGS